MKRIKASLAALFLTAATCSVLIGASSVRSSVGLAKVTVPVVISSIEQGIMVGSGTFPGSVYCEYADDKGVYHTKYNSRRNISIYDLQSGQSNIVRKPEVPGNYIHTFIKNKDYTAWEEDSGKSIDSERQDKSNDWKVYVDKNGTTTLVDEGKPVKIGANAESTGISPIKLSLYGDYLVYRTYDTVPGTNDNGVVIKLYDIKKEKLRAIFSIVDVQDFQVSNPNIYKNYIVWSTVRKKAGDVAAASDGELYLYSIKHNSYIKIAQGEDFINPVIWEDYIVCVRNSNKNPSITIFNFNTAFKKDIVFSDYSLFPKKEFFDYSIGEGYVTWNNSHADSVSVYDIANGKVIELKKNSQEEGKSNSLLNIRLYGKRIVYTDHLFDKKTGRTISEVNRYIDLR